MSEEKILDLVRIACRAGHRRLKDLPVKVNITSAELLRVRGLLASYEIRKGQLRVSLVGHDHARICGQRGEG